MNPKCMIAVACLALMSVTPALAAPPEIEDFCFDQASQVRFSGRGEREAFIANCIANLTPPPGNVPIDVEIGGQALPTLSR
jgi:hypothetical protein